MVLIINKDSKKEDFEKFLNDRSKKQKTGFNAKKYCGVIPSFKNLDANKVQENLRNEW
jgi:hypothetical protein